MQLGPAFSLAVTAVVQVLTLRFAEENVEALRGSARVPRDRLHEWESEPSLGGPQGRVGGQEEGWAPPGSSRGCRRSTPCPEAG